MAGIPPKKMGAPFVQIDDAGSQPLRMQGQAQHVQRRGVVGRDAGIDARNMLGEFLEWMTHQGTALVSTHRDQAHLARTAELD